MGGMVGYRWNFPSMLRSIEPPWLHGKTTGTIYHAKKRQKRLDSERFQEVRLRTLARNVRMGQEYWYGYFRYSSQSCCSWRSCKRRAWVSYNITSGSWWHSCLGSNFIAFEQRQGNWPLGISGGRAVRPTCVDSSLGTRAFHGRCCFQMERLHAALAWVWWRREWSELPLVWGGDFIVTGKRWIWCSFSHV